MVFQKNIKSLAAVVALYQQNCNLYIFWCPTSSYLMSWDHIIKLFLLISNCVYQTFLHLKFYICCYFSESWGMVSNRYRIVMQRRLCVWFFLQLFSDYGGKNLLSYGRMLNLMSFYMTVPIDTFVAKIFGYFQALQIKLTLKNSYCLLIY